MDESQGYNIEPNRGLLRGCGKGWSKWVRGIKESTPEIIVSLYANLYVNFKK